MDELTLSGGELVVWLMEELKIFFGHQHEQLPILEGIPVTEPSFVNSELSVIVQAEG